MKLSDQGAQRKNFLKQNWVPSRDIGTKIQVENISLGVKESTLFASNQCHCSINHVTISLLHEK